ncbi:unnamed protein product, partial [Durusdinium trenchii]
AAHGTPGRSGATGSGDRASRSGERLSKAQEAGGARAGAQREAGKEGPMGHHLGRNPTSQRP